MPECPACLGDGHLDMRDDDAVLGELMSDAELAYAKRAGLRHPCGIVACQECGTTGVVSEERAAEIAAESRVLVDRVLRRIAEG